MVSIPFFICKGYRIFQPVALVVPHHNIVKAKRLEFLQQIAKKRPSTNTIVLIAPDHFSPYQHALTYADLTWHLSVGDIYFQSQWGESLEALASKRNDVVSQDHGIFNVLADIKVVWPNAKVVPIIIGQEAELSQLNPFIQLLTQKCDDQCVVIASVDFSHYLPSALANIHDVKSIRALENSTVEEHNTLEVDSNQSLYVLSQFARQKSATNFHLFSHTNSGEIEQIRDAETTSHVMGWYQPVCWFCDQKANEFQRTFLLALDLHQKRDGKTVGERFFYGVDDIDLQLSHEQQLGRLLVVRPSIEACSTLSFEQGKLIVDLSNELSVAGVVRDDTVSVVFLPLQQKDGSSQLLTGSAKTEYFDQLFSTVSMNSDAKVMQLDIYNGIITLQ